MGLRRTGRRRVAEGRPKDAPGIAILLSRQSCGYQLGDSQWKAVGGKQERDIVNIESRPVISHALVADNIDHGNPVGDADKTHDDRRRRQNASLYNKI